MRHPQAARAPLPGNPALHLRSVPIATLDLRVAFQRPVPTGADIVMRRRVHHAGC